MNFLKPLGEGEKALTECPKNQKGIWKKDLKKGFLVGILRGNFCLAAVLYPRQDFTSIGPLGKNFPDTFRIVFRILFFAFFKPFFVSI